MRVCGGVHHAGDAEWVCLLAALHTHLWELGELLREAGVSQLQITQGSQRPLEPRKRDTTRISQDVGAVMVRAGVLEAWGMNGAVRLHDPHHPSAAMSAWNSS